MVIKNDKNIFISWSGDNSKEIAKELKKSLENVFFTDTGLTCFVSDVDIASGTDWWNKIKKELKTCKVGILCVTKENLMSPWLFFEAGAMIARGIVVIPILFNCSLKSLSDTPLTSKQIVDFYDQTKFIKMISDINKHLNLNISENIAFETMAKGAYTNLKENLSGTLKILKSKRIFNAKDYTYPHNVKDVNINTVYISAPMSNLKPSEYKDLRNYVVNISKALKDIGFVDIICPILSIEDTTKFDGKIKAMKDNFASLKQVDSLVVIYPYQSPSSILVELGYGIALCKRTVIFYRENLPYMVQDAGENVEHIKAFKFDDYSEITDIIIKNGMTIFEGRTDE